MFRKLLITLLLLVPAILFLSNSICAQTVDITIQELIANMKKSGDEIKDFSGIYISKMQGTPTQTFGVFAKEPDKFSLTCFTGLGYSFIIKDGFIYFHSPEKDTIKKTKLPFGVRGPYWPSMKSIIGIIADSIDKVETYSVEKKWVKDRQMYVLILESPSKNRKDIFFINNEDRLPYRQEVYFQDILFLVNEFKEELSINMGVLDDTFDLFEDMPIEEIAFTPAIITSEVKQLSDPRSLVTPPQFSEFERHLAKYEIPIYPGAYEVKRRTVGQFSPIIKIVNYKTKVPYPSKEVLNFYEDIFRKEGWQQFEQPGQSTREWEKYIDAAKEGNPKAARIGVYWADENKQYMMSLNLHHYSRPSEKELTDEEIIHCSIEPYSKYPEPTEVELIEIPGGIIEERTIIEKDGKILEEWITKKKDGEIIEKKIIIGEEIRKEQEEELLQRAMDYYNERDPFNALELFQEFLRDYPKSESVPIVKSYISNCLKDIAYIYKKEGKYRKAIANFRKYLEISSEPEVRGKGYFEPDARAYFDMGQCYEELKDYNKAIDVYNEGISKCPRNKIMGAYMMHRIMTCHEILGQDKSALQAAQRLKEEYPEEDLLLDEKTGEWGYSDKIATKEIRQLKRKIALRWLIYIGIAVIVGILSLLVVRYKLKHRKRSGEEQNN